MSEYKIKVDGTPQTYGEGATRNSKEGKGRYDLIPTEPMMSIMVAYNDTAFLREIEAVRSADAMIMLLYNHAMRREFAYVIILLSLSHDINEFGDRYYHTSKIGSCISGMMEELAHHFEKGALIYGEHNCEKGIPIDSFIDSGMRHMAQFINVTGDREENHWIAAIWNFWMAEWTICMNNKKTFEDTNIRSYQDIMSQIFESPVTIEETSDEGEKNESDKDAEATTTEKPLTVDDIFKN
jgi:hypothetical protein